MGDIVRRVVKNLRDGGLRTLFAKSCPYVYNNYLRRRLPRRRTTYNGVPVRAGRWFDSLVPYADPAPRPDYESGLLTALRRYAQEGQTVVIVGGGWGVSAVVAAERVGTTGSVIVYEGSARKVTHVRETARLNDVADRIDVRHAVVGDAVQVATGADAPQRIDPSALPDCDLLELDCEGAELTILENLAIRPAVITVETHEFLGAPPAAVRQRLDALSYEVVSEVIAAADRPDYAREKGVYVLTAVDVADR